MFKFQVKDQVPTTSNLLVIVAKFIYPTCI